MDIVVGDLDREIKSTIRDDIFKRLVKTYNSLPLPSETDKILDVITDEVMTGLGKVINDYYREFFESDNAHIALSKDDYLNIYLQRI